MKAEQVRELTTKALAQLGDTLRAGKSDAMNAIVETQLQRFEYLTSLRNGLRHAGADQPDEGTVAHEYPVRLRRVREAAPHQLRQAPRIPGRVPGCRSSHPLDGLGPPEPGISVAVVAVVLADAVQLVGSDR